MLLTQITATALQNKKGLALGNQILGWLTLGMHAILPLLTTVASITVPFLHIQSKSHHYLHRLAIIFLAFAPTFIILTISYEGLFYVFFYATLVLWSEIETKVAVSMETPVILSNGVNGHSVTSKPSFRKLALSDARIALFFFILLQVGFFGTGNIASVSSFSLESVYRLVPVFDPFLMGALLIFKILVPFAGMPFPSICISDFSDLCESGNIKSKITCPAVIVIYDRFDNFGYFDTEFFLLGER